jgi:predicted nucleotidyltransferase
MQHSTLGIIPPAITPVSMASVVSSIVNSRMSVEGIILVGAHARDIRHENELLGAELSRNRTLPRCPRSR